MKITIVRHEEIRVPRRERRARGHEDVPRDLSHVEHRGKEAVAILGAEDARRVPRQAGRHRGTELTHDRHEVPRPRVAVDDRVRFSVHAAVNRVQQRVPAPGLRVLEKRRRENPLAGRRERDVDGIVHSAREHDVDRGVAGPAAEDVRRARHERLLAGARVRLLRKRALGPVDPSVGSQVRTVEIVRAARQRLALEPLFAPIRDAVPVGIGQLPDARRRGDVQRPVEPHRPFRQHHPVGEDDAPVEPSVAVGVLEPDDAMGAIGELFFDSVVRPGRIGDVHPAVFVEVRDDRTFDERWSRDPFDFEAGRNREAGRRRSVALLHGQDCQREQHRRDEPACQRRAVSRRHRRCTSRASAYARLPAGSIQAERES